MMGTYVVSLVLIGLSAVLLDSHRRSWRAALADKSLSRGDMRFARSQYRRRTQSSGIIGVLGVAIGVYPLVPREPLPITLYLVAISAACMAIMMLAAIDAWATRQNFVRLRSEQLAGQVKLARDLARDRARLNDG
jgi:hypothetical protein